MSTRYKFWDRHATYFVTFAVVEWVDVFTRNNYRKIVVDSIIYCINNKGLFVHGWVLMTNHVHLLISLAEDSPVTLSDIMRDMKKYTAMHLIKNIKENPQESRKDWMLAIFEKAGKYNSNNTNYQFWKQDNHPIILNENDRYSKALEYIHQNPVTAGLVDNPTSFPWSSAKDYAGDTGMIAITVL